MRVVTVAFLRRQLLPSRQAIGGQDSGNKRWIHLIGIVPWPPPIASLGALADDMSGSAYIVYDVKDWLLDGYSALSFTIFYMVHIGYMPTPDDYDTYMSHVLFYDLQMPTASVALSYMI